MNTAGFVFTGVTSLAFPGKNYVLTGFDAAEETALTLEITKRGGRIRSSLVLDTDYLVVKEDFVRQTVKYQRAVQLNTAGKHIGILSGTEFYTLLGISPATAAIPSVTATPSVSAAPTVPAAPAKKPKPEIVRLSTIPAGPGRLAFEKTAWALIGITGSEKQAYTEQITARGGIVGSLLKRTQYAIYDPERAESLSTFAIAKQRAQEGTLVLIPAPVFDIWSAEEPEEVLRGVWEKDRGNSYRIAEHYLTYPTLWSPEGTWAPMESWLATHHCLLLVSLYENKAFSAMLSLLALLTKEEEAWKQTGYSDGYYTYSLFNIYADKVLAQGDTETVALWLNEKHRLFSEETSEAAECAALDYAFGLKAQPTVYWEPGTTHCFGTYPQTEAGTDQTPIEWVVLARNGSKALILSRYGLDSKAYNEKWVDITWEKCTLRTWLNKDFLNAAFTTAEQAAIQTTAVDNSNSQGYSGYSTNGGNNTEDKVFLLSYAEAWKYFSSDEARKCVPTTFAIAQGAWTSSSNKLDGKATGVWWLRSPGSSLSSATNVDTDGSRSRSSVSLTDSVVRPALWVDIESGI